MNHTPYASRITHHVRKHLNHYTLLAALAAAWLGYFFPWVWPVPVALRLSAHDLVEWMTFMQTVRDGTFPVSRLDLLWPY